MDGEIKRKRGRPKKKLFGRPFQKKTVPIQEATKGTTDCSEDKENFNSCEMESGNCGSGRSTANETDASGPHQSITLNDNESQNINSDGVDVTEHNQNDMEISLETDTNTDKATESLNGNNQTCNMQGENMGSLQASNVENEIVGNKDRVNVDLDGKIPDDSMIVDNESKNNDIEMATDNDNESKDNDTEKDNDNESKDNHIETDKDNQIDERGEQSHDVTDFVIKNVKGGDINTESDYNDVQVRVIEVPDDDNLFDFLTQEKEDENMEKEEDLKKTELYKYLTEESQLQRQSEEVTPYPSGDEREVEQIDSSSSDDDESSGSTSSSDDDDDEFDMEEMLEGETLSERIAKEAQMEREYKQMESQMKTTIEKKQTHKTPPTKTMSIREQQAQWSKMTMEKLEKSKEVTKQWLKDLSVPENLTFSKPIQMKMVDLNQYLTCGMCKGYLYEASTITECMHTFCKNCIVRHCMEVSLHCPVCSILIHPTDPFVNIRLDRMIQDIVYKILPNVAETEMKRIEEFYEKHPEVEQKEMQLPPPKQKMAPKEHNEPAVIHTPRYSTLVSVVLEAEEQHADQEVLEKKFVRVSSQATVASVCEFLKRKLSLQDKQVDLFCCGDAMEESQCTLQTIKTNFFGDQEDLMLLQYRIRET